jgi:hypothetical protein
VEARHDRDSNYHEDLHVCEALEAELATCRTVGEVRQAVAAHEHCPECCHVADQGDAAVVAAMAKRAQEDAQVVVTLQEARCSLAECRAYILEMERAA